MILKLNEDPQVRAWLQDAWDLGLIGPQPLEVQLSHSLMFCEVVTRFVTTSSDLTRVFDLGSGSGLPGLVLGMVIPGASVFLVESMERRVAFLEKWMELLPLKSEVNVLHGRAEEFGRNANYRESADLVVARGFSTPSATAECASGLLLVGGHAIVSGPPAEEKESRWGAEGLALLSLSVADTVDNGASFTVLKKDRTTDSSYPRRVGVPKKRPLF